MSGKELYEIYTTILIGMMIMLSLSACGRQKYKVNFDGAFESKRTQYAAGEKETVRYDTFC
jgi:hypothetical protein